MKYLKYFEAITSHSYSNNKEFIQQMEDDISDIFVDMLNNGYDINYKLTDYAGNIGNITIKCGKYQDAIPLKDCLNEFKTLQKYLQYVGYDFYSINLGGWILDDTDPHKRCLSFRKKDWDFVESKLLDAITKGGRGGQFLYQITIDIIKSN